MLNLSFKFKIILILRSINIHVYSDLHRIIGIIVSKNFHLNVSGYRQQSHRQHQETMNILTKWNQPTPESYSISFN